MVDKIFNFTICVPTFNRQLDLQRLFNSLCLQTYKNFDVVVVDNNSVDDTQKLCEEFTKKFPIKYIKKQTTLTEAQNLALKNTESTFFLRTDDDAEFKNNTLEIILKTFLSDNRIGGVSVVTETNDKKRRNIVSIGIYYRDSKTLYFLCKYSTVEKLLKQDVHT